MRSHIQRDAASSEPVLLPPPPPLRVQRRADIWRVTVIRRLQCGSLFPLSAWAKPGAHYNLIYLPSLASACRVLECVTALRLEKEAGDSLPDCCASSLGAASFHLCLCLSPLVHSFSISCCCCCFNFIVFHFGPTARLPLLFSTSCLSVSLFCLCVYVCVCVSSSSVFFTGSGHTSSCLVLQAEKANGF